MNVPQKAFGGLTHSLGLLLAEFIGPIRAGAVSRIRSPVIQRVSKSIFSRLPHEGWNLTMVQS